MDLRYCPFCDGEGELVKLPDSKSLITVECKHCKARSAPCFMGHIAIDYWNERESVQGGWIDIRSQTPKKEDDHNQDSYPVFLVTNGKNVAIAAWVDELGKFGASDGIYSKITHWMPAPRLPEGV